MLPVRTTVAAIAVLLAIAPLAARADEPADVDSLIAIVKSKPRGMELDAWKEKRRDAARQLGRLGDKKAVPVLIEVVETENFDVISEIAIEALGRLGDKRAVPSLRKVQADSSRDQYVRDAAATALRRLGEDTATPPGGPTTTEPLGQIGPTLTPATPGGPTTPGTPSTVPEPGAILGGAGRQDIPVGPKFAADTIAVSERLTLAVGGVSLAYDTVRDTASLDADARATWERIVERSRLGYGVSVGAAVAAGAIDYEGDGSGRELAATATGTAEARFYAVPDKWHGLLEGALGVEATGIQASIPAADSDVDDLRLGADVHIGLGGGYGRVLDIGEALRLRRIEAVLQRSRLLGRPITGDLAGRVLGAWWALRGEQGAERRLLATIRILRDGGVLVSEPDPATTYEILAVLLDGQLDHRLSGWDARLGVGESYVVREDEAPLDDGRVETVFARGRYGHQSPEGKRELVGSAFARYRILAADGEPSPWAAGAEVAWRRYMYGEALDPIGGLELEVSGALSDDDIGDPNADVQNATHLASSIGASVGWLWAPSRASRFRLSGSLAVVSGELFVGANFDVAYGFLDTGYLGASAYPPR